MLGISFSMYRVLDSIARASVWTRGRTDFVVGERQAGFSANSVRTTGMLGSARDRGVASLGCNLAIGL